MAAAEQEDELERYRSSLALPLLTRGGVSAAAGTRSGHLCGKTPPPLLAGGRCAAAGWVSQRSSLFASRKSVKEKLRPRLRAFDVGDKFSRLPLAKASVLLPLLVREGRLHLLLTVRAMQVGARPGPARPGGTPGIPRRGRLRGDKSWPCVSTSPIHVFQGLLPKPWSGWHGHGYKQILLYTDDSQIYMPQKCWIPRNL